MGSGGASVVATMFDGRVDSGSGSSSSPARASSRNGLGPSLGSQRGPIHREFLPARDDRVRFGARAVADAVAGGDAMRPAVLPAEADATKHVEELLLVGVDVHRHGALAGAHPVPTQARAGGTRGGAEPLA